jgi:type I restriction enzyme S subunit
MSWQTFNLIDICEINIGKTPSRSNMKYWKDGTEPWLSIADMSVAQNIKYTKEKITLAAVKETNIKLVQPNTVLLSYKLSVGKVGISDMPLYTNEAIAALPIKNKNLVDTRYLIHALKNINFYLGAERAAKGVTLNKEKLKTVKIKLPNLEEQIKIAYLLDQIYAIELQHDLAKQQLKNLYASAWHQIKKNHE